MALFEKYDEETAKQLWLGNFPELKPCPFCGIVPNIEDPDCCYPTGTIWRDNSEYGFREYGRPGQFEPHGWCYKFSCTKDGVGCGCEVHGDSREEVIEKWNGRK